jgi:hypothetical protein
LSILTRWKSTEWIANAACRAAVCGMITFATAAGSFSADTHKRALNSECDGEAECNLHLVADEERPFLWQGKVVGDPDEDIPEKMRNLLEGPVRKYPSLASCVINPGVIAQDLDHAKLRWSEFRSQHEAEVCLFRLFDRLETTDRILAWLVELGFIEPNIREGEDLLWGRVLKGRPVVEFAATWSVRNSGPLYGSFWDRLRQRGLSSFTVQGVTDNTRGLIWVFIKETSKIQK